ncbi:MAG TPA: hypothetical protein VN740_01130, partial [Solirubrobacteraceae bacterium]|nr:hypothetical protein [Solirubrobacteraceae bacterium]
MSVADPRRRGTERGRASARLRRGAGPSQVSWLGPLALAVAAAEVAVIALRPRDGLLAASPVDAGSFFEADEVARAR